jgi:hypothetical protein
MRLISPHCIIGMYLAEKLYSTFIAEILKTLANLNHKPKQMRLKLSTDEQQKRNDLFHASNIF